MEVENPGQSSTSLNPLGFPKPISQKSFPNTLKPKIKLFQDLGLSDSNVADLIVSKPLIMYRNMENHIKPIFNSVRSIVETDENLIKTIMCCRFLLTGGFGHLLREHGVPDSSIVYLFMTSSRVFLHKTVIMEEAIGRVERFGFNSESRKFAKCSKCSSKKLKEGIEFYAKNLNWDASVLSKNHSFFWDSV